MKTSSNDYDSEGQLAAQFESASRWLREHLPTVALVSLGLTLALWLASGFYMVTSGHIGVVRTFGKETDRTQAGLHYRFPWPFQSVDVVNVEQIRRVQLGFREGQRAHEEALMLTGDENIVEAQMVVQYRLADPSKFLFRLRDPEGTLRAAIEVALRSTVGGMTIDEVMIENRAKVQEDTRIFVQRLMDDYQSGLTITEVKLQAADPPDPVKDAFHDVVRAREDREKLINQALGYQADLLPRARGRAQEILREAEGYREKRILIAKGEAARFLSVLAEYEKAKEVTRERLHLESVEKILSEVDKIIVDGSIGQRLMPLLPIGGAVTLPANIAPEPLAPAN
ncbi:MAG: FtsH protease activity modulator HflK [Terrimicrobiaceae bacterium]